MAFLIRKTCDEGSLACRAAEKTHLRGANTSRPSTGRSVSEK